MYETFAILPNMLLKGCTKFACIGVLKLICVCEKILNTYKVIHE